jgi:chemotaxis protein methyltransferase CheR
MAARSVLGDDSGWKLNILATDLNPRFLGKAAQGIYGPWSFRTLPEKMREKYFHRHASDRWRIDDRLRRDVTFGGLNLVDDSFPSAASGTQSLDVIFCRNVLIYFDGPTKARIVERIRETLFSGGYLILGSTETSIPVGHRFRRQTIENVTVYEAC